MSSTSPRESHARDRSPRGDGRIRRSSGPSPMPGGGPARGGATMGALATSIAEAWRRARFWRAATVLQGVGPTAASGAAASDGRPLLPGCGVSTRCAPDVPGRCARRLVPKASGRRFAVCPVVAGPRHPPRPKSRCRGPEAMPGVLGAARRPGAQADAAARSLTEALAPSVSPGTASAIPAPSTGPASPPGDRAAMSASTASSSSGRRGLAR